MRMDTWGAWVVVAVVVCGSAGLAACRGSDAREPQTPPELSLVLSLPDRSFAAGEAVPLLITLQNVGKEPARVNARMLVATRVDPHDVVLTLLGPDKREMSMRVRINIDPEGLDEIDWRTIAPRAGVSTTYDIAHFYDLSAPGFYAVQAIYESAKDAPGGATPFKGRLASTVLRFRRS